MTNEQAAKILGQYDVGGVQFYWTDGTPIPVQDGWDAIETAIAALKEKTVVPHRNYSYLSQWWCECGWHLGRIDSGVKYCANCGRKVDWDGAV